MVTAGDRPVLPLLRACAAPVTIYLWIKTRWQWAEMAVSQERKWPENTAGRQPFPALAVRE